MRPLASVLLIVCVAFVSVAADKPDLAKRHGLDVDLKTYPQATPKEALASVLKAIDDKKADYVTAHLADPVWVDRRLKEEALKFPDFVETVKTKLIADPGPAKQLKRFLADGQWDVKDDQAIVKLKDVADRWVYLRQIDGRWFMEQRFQPEEKK